MKTKPKAWYQLRAQGDDADEVELLIYDDIGRNWWGEGISAEDLIHELAEIEASTMSVRINSVGGQVFEGFAIYNALLRHSARIVTHIDGIAASIASVVALAGEEVRIAENGFVMIHNAWGVAIGNARDMRELADVLDKLDGSLANTYAQKTGADRADVLEWMAAETWYNAEEAEELGFVDAIEGKRDVEGSFDLSRFAHVPTEVAASLGGRDPSPRPAVDWDALKAAIELAGLPDLPLAASAEGPAPELVTLAAESYRTLEATRL